MACPTCEMGRKKPVLMRGFRRHFMNSTRIKACVRRVDKGARMNILSTPTLSGVRYDQVEKSNNVFLGYFCQYFSDTFFYYYFDHAET